MELDKIRAEITTFLERYNQKKTKSTIRSYKKRFYFALFNILGWDVAS
jgi:hypothetical protein